MPDIVSIPYVFGNLSGSIPLSFLDADMTALVNSLNGLGNGSPALQTVVIGTANIGSPAISNLSMQNVLAFSMGGTGANIASFTDGKVLIGSNVTGGLSVASITATAPAALVPGPGTLSLSRVSNAASRMRVVTFTAIGQATFTANASTMHKITVIGGGGAGGGAQGARQIAGAGAGAGGTALSWSFLNSGDQVTVTVGKGGNGSNSLSEAGGNSSVAFSNGSVIVATGGSFGDSAGTGNLSVNGGPGGPVIGGAINITGGSGSPALNANCYPALVQISGAGGASVMGFGGDAVFCPSNTAVASVPGKSGQPFGGGGSGCGLNTGSARGGNGAPGIVMIEWLY